MHDHQHDTACQIRGHPKLDLHRSGTMDNQNGAQQAQRLYLAPQPDSPAATEQSDSISGIYSSLDSDVW